MNRFFVVVLLIQTACASSKMYPLDSTTGNLSINSSRPAGLLTYQQTSLFIFEELPNCRRFFHGEVPIRSQPVQVSLPLNRQMTVYFAHARQNVLIDLSAQEEFSQSWFPKGDEIYFIDYSERKGSTQLLFRQKKKNSERLEPIASASAPKCAKFEIAQ